MTIAELILALSAYPPETKVVIDGYEGGYHDAGPLKEIELVRDYHHQSYYGPHETSDYPLPEELANRTVANHVYISRSDHREFGSF